MPGPEILLLPAWSLRKIVHHRRKVKGVTKRERLHGLSCATGRFPENWTGHEARVQTMVFSYYQEEQLLILLRDISIQSGTAKSHQPPKS
jgi:hypothetical protein